MSACQRFSPVAPFFFSGKSTIFGFLEYRKGCGHIDRYACDDPLVTLILNMYDFVGLAFFF